MADWVAAAAAVVAVLVSLGALTVSILAYLKQRHDSRSSDLSALAAGRSAVAAEESADNSKDAVEQARLSAVAATDSARATAIQAEETRRQAQATWRAQHLAECPVPDVVPDAEIPTSLGRGSMGAALSMHDTAWEVAADLHIGMSGYLQPVLARQRVEPETLHRLDFGKLNVVDDWPSPSLVLRFWLPPEAGWSCDCGRAADNPEGHWIVRKQVLRPRANPQDPPLR